MSGSIISDYLTAVKAMAKHTTPVVDTTMIPQVALESMNDTHREEVELVNQLGALLEQGLEGNADNAAITGKLHEWVEHTRAHFERENRLMQEHGFPAFPVHSGEHSQMLAIIEDLQRNWLDNGNIETLANFIFHDWARWFELHVNSMDKVTAQFLSQHISE